MVVFSTPGAAGGRCCCECRLEGKRLVRDERGGACACAVFCYPLITVLLSYYNGAIVYYCTFHDNNYIKL